MDDLKKISLPEDWKLIEPELRSKFSQELRNELSSSHDLYGIEASVIARKSGRDDFLYSIEHPEYSYAEVHLTWRVETNPIWPSTSLFKDIDDWKQFLIDDEL